MSTHLTEPKSALHADTASLFLNHRFVKYFAGDRGTIAVKANGEAWMWGGVSAVTPTQVDLGGKKAVSGTVGYLHLIILTEESDVYCTGYAGSCATGDVTTFIQISGLTNIQRVAHAYKATFVQKDDGTWWSFGHNNYGQLGRTAAATYNSPGQVENIPSNCDLQSGVQHLFCLVPGSSTAWGWGRNDNRQLGDGTTAARPTPVQITLPGVVTQMALGLYSSYAMVEGQPQGTFYAWGLNEGRFGDGLSPTLAATPLLIAPSNLAGKTITKLGVMLVQTNENEVYTWGHDRNHGQLGRPILGDDYASPMPVALDPTAFNRVYDQESNTFVWLDEGGLTDLSYISKDDCSMKA